MATTKTTAARVAALVDEAYNERPFKNEISPAMQLDSAITAWVTIMQRQWEAEDLCTCIDCPGRPQWDRDLTETYNVVPVITQQVEEIMRRGILEAFAAFAEKHPEAPWAEPEAA